MFARRTGHLDAEVRLAFGKVKPLGAIRKHRRCGLAGIEPALVDLCDVGDQLGFDAS